MSQRLTAKHERFARAYLRTLNATEAAKEAGYSARSAEVTGFRLLRDAKVARLIASREKQKLERMDVRADHVLEGLRRVAFLDPADFIDPNTNEVLPIHKMPAEARMALAGLRVTKDGTAHVMFNNRVEALDKLARHLNLLRPENASAPIAGPVTMNCTEIYLDGLTNQELDVLERLLERKQVVDQRRARDAGLFASCASVQRDSPAANFDN
jgi:phage terminase small subunit